MRSADRSNDLRGFVPAAAAILAMAAGISLAGGGGANISTPIGEPVLDPPTLRCLGVYWIIRGDANRNGRVTVEYRKGGSPAWQAGYPLFRVEKGASRPPDKPGSVEVPPDAWLLAGSVVGLQPGTRYELRLRLADPDGGSAEKQLQASTRIEPVAPTPARRLHVTPGAGGGRGSETDPFRGLAAAAEAAQPGDLFLLRAGTYEGSFKIGRSGEPGRPIIWRGQGDRTVLDGKGAAERRVPRAIDAVGIHDVWIEDLAVRNADYGIVAHDSARLVVRRCSIRDVEFGLAATRNTGDSNRDFFIADNTIVGPSTWPRTMGIENARGIQVTGAGHVVCYNRILRFGDAIDTFPSPRCAAIDFHNNDLADLTDDGIEMDYSERNTRCFENRMVNVFQGISVQPVYGGPVYVFRNVLYNVVIETFKMHNSPSGALMFHNTSVKKGSPLVLWTSAKVRNSVYRNNLFIGTDGRAAYDNDAPMEDCDFDYDGFGGGPWPVFLKWNRARYATLDEVRARAPVYRHAVHPDAATVFASGLRPPEDETKAADTARVDVRLRSGTLALDVGQPLPGFNDGYAGKGPDLGAVELGSPVPHYGPRPSRS